MSRDQTKSVQLHIFRKTETVSNILKISTVKKKNFSGLNKCLKALK